jgi:hypothetical protein
MLSLVSVPDFVHQYARRYPECVNGFETLFSKNYCRSFSSFPG